MAIGYRFLRLFSCSKSIKAFVVEKTPNEYKASLGKLSINAPVKLLGTLQDQLSAVSPGGGGVGG